MGELDVTKLFDQLSFDLHAARLEYSGGVNPDPVATRQAWEDSLSAILRHLEHFGIVESALPLLDLFGAIADLESGNVHPGLKPDKRWDGHVKNLFVSRLMAEAAVAIDALRDLGEPLHAAAATVSEEINEASLAEWSADQLIEFRRKIKRKTGNYYPTARKLYPHIKREIGRHPKSDRASVAICVMKSRRSAVQ